MISRRQLNSCFQRDDGITSVPEAHLDCEEIFGSLLQQRDAWNQSYQRQITLEHDRLRIRAVRILTFCSSVLTRCRMKYVFDS